MAQTGNENESFAYLEARSTHRATSTPDSSRGVTIGNGSETNASSVSPLDPEIGPLKGHTNHSIRSKNSHQDDPWWGNTVLTLGLWKIGSGPFFQLLISMRRWRWCKRLFEFVDSWRTNEPDSKIWKWAVPRRSRGLQCAPSPTSLARACSVYSY